jgi:CBS domain-containing protein
VKVGELAAHQVISVGPRDSLRTAARMMTRHGTGCSLVRDGDAGFVGILSERDILQAVAASRDPDATEVHSLMTADVVTVGPDWEVYEAAAEMAARHIRHLVVSKGDEILGVLSVRDVLLAGQRVELSAGSWVILRDPLTFTIRERRRLQRCLLQARGDPSDPDQVDGLICIVVGSWSFDAPLPSRPDDLDSIPDGDREMLRAAVRAELPDLQRAVHPSPGWRRR